MNERTTDGHIAGPVTPGEKVEGFHYDIIALRSTLKPTCQTPSINSGSTPQQQQPQRGPLAKPDARVMRDDWKIPIR